ncbi:MAG: dTDP-4-dehydrorhamnose reductase [Candidatus Omnitrophica bacterium]|nr:dTDP-4-dehydrorhamnose reductase [Candidatus Omnitrophota bacterium]
MKVLITGSSGMLGMDLILALKDSCDITGIDIIENKSPKGGAITFKKCDITDRNEILNVIDKINPEVVIHAAAWTDVDSCELDKEKAMAVNYEGTHNVALGCKNSGALMFYISTDFIFDGSKSEPYLEDDKAAPVNIYGLSKLKGEEAVRKELYRYCIVRTSWLFGKYGRNFVDIILDKADANKELRVVFDQFGSPTFTKDLSEAISNLMDIASKNKEMGGVYHFCNSGTCSWFKYAEEILKIANRTHVRIVPITSQELNRPAARPPMSALNTEKYCDVTGEVPREWRKALEDYLFNEHKIKRDYVQGNKG